MSEKSRERLDRLKRIAGQMYGDDAPSDSALDIIEAVLAGDATDEQMEAAEAMLVVPFEEFEAANIHHVYEYPIEFLRDIKSQGTGIKGGG